MKHTKLTVLMDNKCIFIFNLIIVVIITLTYFHFSTAQPVSSLSIDQHALEAIKSQIILDPSGILSKNWSAKASVCNWERVTCSSQSQTTRVIALDLSYMGVVGTISPYIGNLSFLSLLDLTNNSFHGSIPREIAQLRHLERVYMGNNSLTGVLPLSYFNNMPKLEILHLDQNNLTGTLSPYFLDNMTSLMTLRLNHNSLHGNIPEQIGNRTCLQRFYVNNNQLTGSVPRTFFNQSCLRRIELSVNSLSGSLPDDMCSDQLGKLMMFFISGNEFTGPIPSSIIKCQQLRYVSMSYNKFNGTIPRGIGNLTLLKQLFLGLNDFQGSIPSEIGRLKRLEILSIFKANLEGHVPQLIFNMSCLKMIDFHGNNLSGVLPDHAATNILEQLFLGNNQFSGHLPSWLWKLKKIRLIALYFNNFTGNIPAEIANLTQLTHLYLGFNKLTGVIPDEINHLDHLEDLSLTNNSIGGNIRFNISTLKKLALPFNLFSGELPADMGFMLPNLQELYLGYNAFQGPLPTSIINSSKLSVIDLSENLFTGPIPTTIGRLELLERLLIGGNSFTADGSELNFLSSLTNCRRLQLLAFANNPINSSLPASIGNFSTSLQVFQAFGCGLKGIFPSGIGNLTSLLKLSLDMNELEGNIPTTLGKLQNMGQLFLEDNRLKGGIPQELCLLKSLEELYLSKNPLSGIIPPCFGNFSSLTWLFLDSTSLTSTIPSALYSHKSLVVLNLSSNSLTGNIPSTGSSNSHLTELDLSFNKLSGDIPSSIGGYQMLTILSLAHNNLQGSIPESLGNLISLELLDFSENSLSGEIPRSFETLTHLEYLNLSFNLLQGEIPSRGPFDNFTASSFMHNKDLCGAPKLQVLPCKNKKHETGTFSSLKYILPVIASVTVLVVVVYLLRRHKKRIRTNVEPPSLVKWTRVSYYELVRATESFDESNLIGSGAYGSVYKGKLSDGVNVAVKVFNMLSEGAMKSFNVECEVLRNIRHKNLVRIIFSSCTNLDFRCLVMEYMPNGSLEQWLYSHNNHLSLVQRMQVLIDVASALEYLHHGQPTPIIHCDLKPSNVLLDEDMHAHVCDFGIAKIFGEEEFRLRTATLGTIGYMAPEYGMEGIVSTGSDVYSFGILLLETFTRKKPTEDTFCGEVSLRSWVLEATQRSVFEVVDEDLINEHLYSKQESLASVFNLAMDCTSESPSLRINMKETVVRLCKIHKSFLSNN